MAPTVTCQSGLAKPGGTVVLTVTEGAKWLSEPPVKLPVANPVRADVVIVNTSLTVVRSVLAGLKEPVYPIVPVIEAA